MLKNLAVLATLFLASCTGEANVVQVRSLPSFRNDIMIRMRACDFIYKCFDDEYGAETICLIKWSCPSSFQ